MRELHFGVIGAGFWGRYQIAAWKEVPGARLEAVCDRDGVRASAVAREFGIARVYTNAEEMLRVETLDFVDIATGPETHEQLVLLAAAGKVSVICQKPMALDYPTCDRMVDACRQAGVPFLIHENYRWQAPMRRLKELLGSGRVGRPFRAHIQFSHGAMELFDSQPYLYTQPHFALYDMGPHLLDLPRFFFGEPSSVYAREFKINERFAGEDVVSVVLGYDRLVCHCELTWRTTGYDVFIEGTEGAITSYPDGRITMESTGGVQTESVALPAYAWADPRYGFVHSSIVATNTHLFSALRGVCTAETTAEDNLKTMRLLFRALESAEGNQVLPV